MFKSKPFNHDFPHFPSLKIHLKHFPIIQKFSPIKHSSELHPVSIGHPLLRIFSIKNPPYALKSYLQTSFPLHFVKEKSFYEQQRNWIFPSPSPSTSKNRIFSFSEFPILISSICSVLFFPSLPHSLIHITFFLDKSPLLYSASLLSTQSESVLWSVKRLSIWPNFFSSFFFVCDTKIENGKLNGSSRGKELNKWERRMVWRPLSRSIIHKMFVNYTSRQSPIIVGCHSTVAISTIIKLSLETFLISSERLAVYMWLPAWREGVLWKILGLD